MHTLYRNLPPTPHPTGNPTQATRSVRPVVTESPSKAEGSVAERLAGARRLGPPTHTGCHIL